MNSEHNDGGTLEHGKRPTQATLVPAHITALAKQAQRLAGVGSAYAQIAKNLPGLQPPVVALASQYKSLLGPDTALGQTFKAMRLSERSQFDSIRKTLAPLEDIRRRLQLERPSLALAAGLIPAHAFPPHVKELLAPDSSIGSMMRMLAQQPPIFQVAKSPAFEHLNLGSNLHHFFKDFESANKKWMVPNEVLGIVDSFKGIREQFGKVPLPTIDWESAGALAQLLGREGLQEQLERFGIARDGSVHPASDTSEKGLLSRKQSDALTLLSLLLTLLIFFYQEYSGQLDKAKTETFQAETTSALQTQARQIQHLTVLIEKALKQAANTPEERFVVRERVAIVRTKPQHGASMEGKLLPNEVVRCIDEDGKWIEVQYYHWIQKEYRTGWVLKKYLDRVPATYADAQ